MSKVTRLAAFVGGDEVAIRSIAPPPSSPRRRASVLVPPLIGGSGLQQVGYFRALNEAGYHLFTFDYRGHGRSGGRFHVASTIEDARAVLRVVRTELGGEPLFGVADCYGCIPLLCAAADEPTAFRALALFNPIPSLQHIAPPAAVLAEYFLPLDTAGKRRLAWRDPSTCAAWSPPPRHGSSRTWTSRASTSASCATSARAPGPRRGST
jgi:alpha-beta hydrolase superfamily lysophospholipase